MGEIIELKGNELRQLQLIELEMLVEVDRICRKNGIDYTLDGGTLLGAVRNKGFIPWDDDLDVIFTHENYNRFYEACKKDLDTSRFFFQDYRNEKAYRWGYGKLRRKGTEYIKYGQEKMKYRTGICIDVFNYENIPDDIVGREKYLKRCFYIRKALYSELGRTAEPKLWMRALYHLVYLIPKKWIYVYKDMISQKFALTNTNNVMNIWLPFNREECKYGFPSKLFESYVDIEFEGMVFKAMSGYETFLRMKYGNYMNLPPVEKRHGVMKAVKYEMIDITHDEIVRIHDKGLENVQLL